jgi:hypothetical protein
MKHQAVFLVALMLLARPAWSAEPAAKAKPVTKAVKAPATRTLDAIRIEGEIDVPQVLFITARDYRRFRDRTPAAYQTTSADVTKTIPHPNRVRMVAPVE